MVFTYNRETYEIVNPLKHMEIVVPIQSMELVTGPNSNFVLRGWFFANDRETYMIVDIVLPIL